METYVFSNWPKSKLWAKAGMQHPLLNFSSRLKTMPSDLLESRKRASIPRQVRPIVSEIRKQNEFFTTDEQRNITLRSLEEIGLIKQSIADWQSFSSNIPIKDLFQGPQLRMLNLTNHVIK